jgi:hypothetical protein
MAQGDNWRGSTGEATANKSMDRGGSFEVTGCKTWQLRIDGRLSCKSIAVALAQGG